MALARGGMGQGQIVRQTGDVGSGRAEWGVAGRVIGPVTVSAVLRSSDGSPLYGDYQLINRKSGEPLRMLGFKF